MKSTLLPCCALALLAASCQTQTSREPSPLDFDASAYTISSIVMPSGDTVEFKAYEKIFYVTNVEDSTYQTLNIYVPTDLKGRHDSEIPILMRQYVGGFMAATAKSPSPTDASGRALQEGYVVCIPGARGANSTVGSDGKTVCTGIAPNGLLDLKAAVRYLRYNDSAIPGNSDRIFIDGTSAGGAMASLIGTTGNRSEYAEYLEAMGAADAPDNVFGSICYCPIVDLDHADMEYEWLYGCTNHQARHLDSVQCRISDELAALAPAYINSLNLVDEKGRQITAENYLDYLKSFIIASAQRALQEGVEIPDTIGIIRYVEAPNFGDGRAAPSFGPAGKGQDGERRRAPRFFNRTDFVADVDLDTYLNYVASVQPLKTPPAFDQMDVIIPYPSPENKLFAYADGTPNNFTEFSYEHREHNADARLPEDILHRVYLMNPMYFIGDTTTPDNAPHWYIRHGAKDRDTSFLVPINLATKLRNAGYDVDFFLPWNRPHSGDYNLDDLFAWIAKTME